MLRRVIISTTLKFIIALSCLCKVSSTGISEAVTRAKGKLTTDWLLKCNCAWKVKPTLMASLRPLESSSLINLTPDSTFEEKSGIKGSINYSKQNEDLKCCLKMKFRTEVSTFKNFLFFILWPCHYWQIWNSTLKTKKWSSSEFSKRWIIYLFSSLFLLLVFWWWLNKLFDWCSAKTLPDSRTSWSIRVLPLFSLWRESSCLLSLSKSLLSCMKTIVSLICLFILFGHGSCLYFWLNLFITGHIEHFTNLTSCGLLTSSTTWLKMLT